MIIKDIIEKQISAPGTILPFKKNGIFPIKINKSIEMDPNNEYYKNQKNKFLETI